VESKIHEKGSGALKNKGEVTIFVHSKHNGHQPRSDADNLFFAKSVLCASQHNEQLIQNKVGALKYVTH
jgi:hypothetical protein